MRTTSIKAFAFNSKVVRKAKGLLRGTNNTSKESNTL